MQFDAQCIACLVKRQFELSDRGPNDPASFAFMREVLQEILDAPEGVAAPYMIPGFTAAYQKYFGCADPYEKVKKDANDHVLSILPAVRPIVEQAADPIEMALKFARTGNLLDFAVLPADTIDRELEKMIGETPASAIDPDCYRHFRADLDKAKTMIIIGDNAGEIAFDLLLVEQIKKAYPALGLSYAVRGGIAQNDATRTDAAYVGMDRLVPVIDSGCSIPGTELGYCSDSFRTAIQNADLVLAKGQANHETLGGCGLNVYYLFLCKCARLAQIIGVPTMTKMFICEKEPVVRQ